MKSKTDLFQLIQAMSKSEKRYFTLDAQKSGRTSARYLELFRAINEMEIYDEKKLKKHFPKNLATDKNYLYEAILRSMRDYRSANSHAARIKELMLDAKYLYERGLYEQSEERLTVAKSLAYELGDQLSVLELNKEHRRLLKDTKRKGYEVQLSQLILEKKNNLQKLEAELTYLDWHDDLLIEIRRNPRRLEDRQKEDLKKRFHHLVESETKEMPKTLQGELRYFQCMALLYQLLDNPDQVYLYYSKIVACWDSTPKYKEEEFYRYILDVSNLLHATFADYDKLPQIPKLLAKLEQERPTSLHDQKILFQKMTTYRLMYYINTGDFKDIDGIVKKIEKGLSQYDIGHGSEMVIIFNVSFLLLIAEEFELCKDWAEKIINRTKHPVRQDIQNAVRILHLVATFESKHFEEIETCLRNTTRFFQKISESSEFYTAILKFIKRQHNGVTTDDRRSLLQLKEYLINLKNNNIPIALGLDELLLLWVESKINRKRITQVIQANLRTANN